MSDISEYFDQKLTDKVLQICLEKSLFMDFSGRHCVFPVYRQKTKLMRALCSFLYRKTGNLRFISGWEYAGKFYERYTPIEEIIGTPQPIRFIKYSPLPHSVAEEDDCEDEQEMKQDG